MNKFNNKKTIIILILLLLVGIVGVTIAYFSNTTSINNLFSTKEYGTTVTEEFVSPDNWLPGDETPKTIKATNSGKVDEAVRISFSEGWTPANSGSTLNGWIHEDGTKSNHTTEEELATDERVAVINFDNTSDWTYNNGYYYYNYKLSPNETTSSLIKSVTFNSKTKLDDTCTENITSTGKTITCNSSGNDYDNATYKLTFTIETVQFNKYASAWGVDVAIAEERQLYCDAFEVGELVTYNNQDYYVLKDSSTEDDYLTLIKKDPLIAEEVNAYSTDYISQDGEYPYFESDTCNENIQTGCSTNYNTSSVKKIIDGWSSSFGDDLVEIDGYKVGLINENIFNDYYEYKIISPSEEGYRLKNHDEIINHIFLSEKTYWINFKTDDSNINMYKLGKYEPITEKIYNKSYIRPVINLKKNAIDNACANNKTILSCLIGDKVTYNDDEYYVLTESNSEQKYVTLIKKDPLTALEINNNSKDYVSENGEYPYFQNDSCNNNNQVGCVVKYDISNVKSLIDRWSNNLKNDLVGKNGYKAYLVNYDNFEALGYEFTHYSDGMYNYKKTDETPGWAYIEGKPFWTMERYSDYSNKAYYISNNLLGEDVYNKLYVRPVINLKKSAIESGCHGWDNNSNNNNNNSNIDNNSSNNSNNSNIDNNNYTSYSLGETVNYNNANYCVINNSSTSDDYVTLIKSDPLTYDELVIYNNGYEIERASDNNDIGTMSYYKSDDCYYNPYTGKNTTGCSSNYDTSNIKNVVDNWGNSFNNDLVEVDGYKARLNTYAELIDLGYILRYHGTEIGHFETDSDTKCVGYSYWFNYGAVFGSLTQTKTYEFHPVRPVINLKKCAIDNTCE